MAIAFGYVPATNIVTVTGGTAGIPATFADFVVADRAGTYTVMDAIATAMNLVLDRLIRPVEFRALQITFTLAGTNAGAGDTVDITGTDAWGNAQNESINVAAGNGAYESAKYWRTITDIDCTGFADGVGTIDAVQGQWGAIWDYGGGAYKLDCRFNVGDDVTPTYFVDKNKVIIISDGVTVTGSTIFDIRDNATFILGELDNLANKTTKNGCVLRALEAHTYAIHLIYARDNSTTYLYSCSIYGADVYAGRTQISKKIRQVWNLSIVGYCYLSQLDVDCDVYNYQNFGADLGTNNITASMDKVFIASQLYYAFSTLISGTSVSNAIVKDIGQSLIRQLRNITDSILTDIETDTWAITWQGGGSGSKVHRKYTCNIHIADKDGVDLAGVVVDCEDQFGNPVWAAGTVVTNATGDIAEQTISRGYCSDPDNNLDTDLTVDYSPHVFTISKAGYETQVLDEITVDHPIVWHEELQNSGSQRPRFRMHGA